MIKIVFFGSSEHSLIVLKSLVNDFNVPLIVTKVDKPSGRDQVINTNPVAQFAIDHQFPLLQIENFSELNKNQIKSYQADIGLCVSFGPPYFDQEMIDIFPFKIVNIHPSPLPKYRGATPGPWQIINGETVSAITFFQIDILPDHGPIISQLPFPIANDETSPSFYQKAFTLSANNLKKILTDYLQNPQKITPQNHDEKSYYKKITKEFGKINWKSSPPNIYRFINAMLPWPVAWTYVLSKDGQSLKMKLFSASLISEKLQIEKVQIEGKKPTLWSEISTYYSLDLTK